MKKSIHIIISGRVQGVGFRYFLREKALFLGVKGWVKNNSDGTVEVFLQGEEELLLKLKEYCSKGPTLAKVSDIKFYFSEIQENFDDFYIKY